jgi:hypothetical protein
VTIDVRDYRPLLVLGLVADLSRDREHFVRVFVAPGHLLLSDLYSIAIEIFVTLLSKMSLISDIAVFLANSNSKLKFFLG